MQFPRNWINQSKRNLSRNQAINSAHPVESEDNTSTKNTSNNTMDYSYLNQAAASFDTNCLQNGMDPASLVNMPCSYGDLTSCSQMSQAYRYTAAAASMARSYNPVQSSVGSTGAAAAMSGLHHPGAPGGQCAVMGARTLHQDVHRSSVFTSSMGMQSE